MPSMKRAMRWKLPTVTSRSASRSAVTSASGSLKQVTQHPFAAGRGTPGPRDGEPGLAGAGATGDAHPPVEVERFERPGLVAADLAEAASGVAGSGLGVPDEGGVGPQHVEHRLHSVVADA